MDAIHRKFYCRSSVTVAKDLVGKLLVRTLENGYLLAGRIVETEAYGGPDDPASHAFRGITPRNEAMFGEAGHAYVYFTYGSHYCLNFVTKNRKKVGAVLIRAIRPVCGIEMMAKLRRNKDVYLLASGPGRLCQALAIDLALDEIDATDTGSPIFVAAIRFEKTRILRSTRIGVTKGRSKKWRFFEANSRFVSRARLIYPRAQK